MFNLSLQILANADSDFLKYADDSTDYAERIEHDYNQRALFEQRKMEHSPEVMGARTSGRSPEDYRYRMISALSDATPDQQRKFMLASKNYYNNTKTLPTQLVEGFGPTLLNAFGLSAPSNASYLQDMTTAQKPYYGTQSNPFGLRQTQKYILQQHQQHPLLSHHTS